MARSPRRDPSGRRIDGVRPLLVWLALSTGMLFAAALLVYFGVVVILRILRS